MKKKILNMLCCTILKMCPFAITDTYCTGSKLIISASIEKCCLKDHLSVQTLKECAQYYLQALIQWSKKNHKTILFSAAVAGLILAYALIAKISQTLDAPSDNNSTLDDYFFYSKKLDGFIIERSRVVYIEHVPPTPSLE